MEIFHEIMDVIDPWDINGDKIGCITNRGTEKMVPNNDENKPF